MRVCSPTSWPSVAALILLVDIAACEPLRWQAQKPLIRKAPSARASGLHGQFLHITDFHPDRFYKPGSSSSADDSCHHGSGSAGIYGAEKSDCDSPVSLINATFDWLKANVAKEIDFVIWTGDSARHDNDELLPRTPAQIRDLNSFIVSKFDEVFGRDRDNDDPYDDYTVPIVPNIGNNDILPHNIFDLGPNEWTRTYLELWKGFIPEEERHEFDQSGWYAVEVIPNYLMVFSLNTMYFFSKNAAVDGCSLKGEPGYRQMEWLRVQLHFLRQRGVKALIIGHVPPARTEGKSNWDETCWQKYALWMRQYRDVVVGSMWGHMNIDHFIMQDFEDIDSELEGGHGIAELALKDKAKAWDEFGVRSANSYVQDLRVWWSQLPKKPKGVKVWDDDDILTDAETAEDDLDHQIDEESTVSLLKKGKKGKKGRGGKGKKHKKPKKGAKRREYLDAIGGHWAERFSVSFVSPSVVPNYFPSYRIITYNVTGIEQQPGVEGRSSPAGYDVPEEALDRDSDSDEEEDGMDSTMLKKKKKKKKDKWRRKRRFTVPEPPTKGTPPGPAYSPQPLSLVGYKQYYANLTHIHNTTVESQGGRKAKPMPREFKFQVLYDTAEDHLYRMREDLTVRRIVDLAARISEGVVGDAVARRTAQDSAEIVSKRPKEHSRIKVTTEEGDVPSDLPFKAMVDFAEEMDYVEIMASQATPPITPPPPPRPEGRKAKGGSSRRLLDALYGSAADAIHVLAGGWTARCPRWTGKRFHTSIAEDGTTVRNGAEGEVDYVDVMATSHSTFRAAAVTASKAGDSVDGGDDGADADAEAAPLKHNDKSKGKGKKGKRRKKHRMNDEWHAFLSRAFVGSMTDEEIRDEFGPEAAD